MNSKKIIMETMKTNKTLRLGLYIGFLVTTLMVASPVEAETVLRTGNDIVVSSDEKIEGNYYASSFFGSTVMSGMVEQDMIAIGASVDVNGDVKEDLHILGANVNVHGAVEGDVRIIGGDVTISESIKGDLVVLGATVKLLPSASVGGDLFFFGGDAQINGVIDGSVFGSAESMTLDATVGKDIDIKINTPLQLGSRASVAGNVSYESQYDLIRNTSTSIGGEVVKNSVRVTDSNEALKDFLIPYLIILFSTLSLYLIFRSEIENLVAHITHSYAVSGFVGLGVIVFGPILSLLLMVTMLGLVVGVISFMLVTILILSGVSFASILAGVWLSKLITKKEQISLIWILLGSAVLYAVLLIPIIGPAIYLAFSTVVIGGLTIALYKLLT